MKHFCTVLLLIAFAFPASAAPGDADDADSLNFEAFHDEKDGAIVIWDADKGELGGFTEKKTTVTYEQPATQATETTDAAARPRAPATGPAVITEDLSPNEARAEAYAAEHAQEKLAQGKGYNGERFMIRVRYTLGTSSKTDYSPSSAVNNLHQQMARYCPQGWLKIREWSVPVEQDYYLHYLFQCASEASAD